MIPWQQMVADVGGELDPETGRPAYRSVIVTVPRQSGKTTLVLGWEVQRAIGWAEMLGQPQRIAYSAQTGNDARKKLLEDQVPVLERHRKVLGILPGTRGIQRGMGNEGVIWRNGSRMGLLASSEDSGHGKTLDLGVKDELFADADLRRDQALIPAMITKPYAQVLTASTAGTDASIALNLEVSRGRAAVESGARSGTAYFEWSALPGTDPDDEDAWWEYMPALGLTVELEQIRHARQSMTEAEFSRAFQNLPTKAEDRVIPPAAWDLVCGGDELVIEGKPTFAFDVNAESTGAAILVISPDRVIEVIDARPGVSWIPGRIAELEKRHSHPTWAHDGAKTSPVASLLPDIRVAHPKPITDLAAACGAFYNAVADGTIRVRRDQALDRAVEGAVRRSVGDGWVWSRKNSTVDISPLVAATLAVGAVGETVTVGGFADLNDFLEE